MKKLLIVLCLILMNGCVSRHLEVELPDDRKAYYTSDTFMRDDKLGSLTYDPMSHKFELKGWEAQTSPLVTDILTLAYEAGKKAATIP